MPTPLTAGLFPGQGSQTVGMGSDLVVRYAIARETFAEADQVLGVDVVQAQLNGLLFHSRNMPQDFLVDNLRMSVQPPRHGKQEEARIAT